MTDPKSILDALQALKVAIDIVKALRAANASFEKAELKFKVAELADALASARLGVATLIVHPPANLEHEDPPLPVDQSDPCDTAPDAEHPKYEHGMPYPWTREHPAIE